MFIGGEGAELEINKNGEGKNKLGQKKNMGEFITKNRAQVLC